jgi:AcrR family transcriptional regulator
MRAGQRGGARRRPAAVNGGSKSATHRVTPGRGKTQTDQAPDATSRQAILEAAARIMATKGYSGASISMICKAANCKASSLYWHYGSKENLFAEVVQWKANHFFGLFPRDVNNTVSHPVGTLDEIAEQVGRALQDDPLFLRFLLLLGLERQDMPAEARNVIVQIRGAARTWWQSLLEAQFSNHGPTTAKLVAQEYAEFGRSLIDGAFFAWEFGDGPDIRKVFRQLMALLTALNDRMTAEESTGTARRTSQESQL